MVETVYRPQVPPGHIYVNDKWKNSELFTFLNRMSFILLLFSLKYFCCISRVQTIMIDSMDFIDFYPSTEFAVIFVTEADLVAGINYRRNLAKLKKAGANYEKNAVIVEKTSISNQYFGSFQKFAVIELGLGIVPVSGPDECCQALVAMVRMGSEDKSNPFMLKPRVPPLETYLLKTLLTVPSLGLINICNASLEELTKIIGASSAQQVYNFFHSC
ncbi:UNVERIFIED_CONTAM: Faap24 [Trichonephila clavipes]